MSDRLFVYDEKFAREAIDIVKEQNEEQKTLARQAEENSEDGEHSFCEYIDAVIERAEIGLHVSTPAPNDDLSDKEKALEALELLEGNSYYGICADDHEVMNIENFNLCIEQHEKAVQTIRAALQDKPAPDLDNSISSIIAGIELDARCLNTPQSVELMQRILGKTEMLRKTLSPHLITKEKLDKVEFHLNSAHLEIANGLNPSDEIEMALKILKGE